MLGCTRCELHRFRKKQVIGRGIQPCNILFIGEGPGRSEDTRGIPFCGQAGRILNSAIRDAFDNACLTQNLVYYITNVVQCRPCDGKAEKNRQPTADEVKACRINLEDILNKCQATAIIFLGKVPETYYRKMFPSATALQHPAYILRQGGIGTPAYRKLVRGITTVLEELNNG